MIVGIGTDIVETKRISRILHRFGDKFQSRVLTSNEMTSLAAQSDRVSWLAKRFAAKEAVVKALGTGVGGGVHFRQIEVTRLEYGAPGIVLTGAALARARRLGASRWHVSLSDERGYAIAFAVLESQDDTDGLSVPPI